MSLVIAIPARLASSRLPNKALLPLAGKPMVAHVIERALEFAASDAAKRRDASVVLATDHPEIAQIAQAYPVTVCMTRSEHPSGSDRLAECAHQLNWRDDTIVVNLQGDEPLMPSACLEQVISLLEKNRRASIASLYAPITRIDELFDPNCVKVVLRDDHRALYFSRAPIPYARDAFAGKKPEQLELPEQLPCVRHLGLYAYRAGALKQLSSAPQSLIERAESLEQLRALSIGLEIVLAQTTVQIPAGIDTEADLERVERYLRQAALPQDHPTTVDRATTSTTQRLQARRILFVCMGNICRSPLSQAYAQKRAQEIGFDSLEFGSRGTYSGTAKQPADLRTQAIARAAGLDLRSHRAQTLSENDFYDFDLLIAHDLRNQNDMLALAPPGMEHKVVLLMSYAPDASHTEVPDPYPGDHQDFILSWQLIKTGVDALFQRL